MKSETKRIVAIDYIINITNYMIHDLIFIDGTASGNNSKRLFPKEVFKERGRGNHETILRISKYFILFAL